MLYIDVNQIEEDDLVQPLCVVGPPRIQRAVHGGGALQQAERHYGDVTAAWSSSSNACSRQCLSSAKVTTSKLCSSRDISITCPPEKRL
ncbi:jg21316 [Pararge aegeria aegeria]|uniref:Jg21316 protein n=1 Tax=Pararge aegeria aegeria TaxID=348720 RepID=A0A8S4QXB4_9NEOP|nr:jg21316 [Pararge aegeria aegeria]